MEQTRPSPLQRPRIVWIDQLKAVAFYFVILGHMGIPDALKDWIYSFHMPLFFFATGLTTDFEKLARTPPADYLKKLVRRLLVPYVWMQLLSMCLRFVQLTVLSGEEVPALLYLRGMARGNNLLAEAPSNPLYYVLVLFVAETVLYLFAKLFRGRALPVTAVSLVLLPASLFTRGHPLPWHLNVVPAAVCMIVTGCWAMRLWKTVETKKAPNLPVSLVLSAALFALGAAVSHWNGRISLHENSYGNSFVLCLIAAFSAFAAISLLVMRLPKIGWLTFAGQSTLLFMGTHKPLLLILEALLPDYKYTPAFLVGASVGVYALMLPLSLLVLRWMPFVAGKDSDFADPKIKAGQAVCLVGATVVPFWYFTGHLQNGVLRSSPLYLSLAVAGYLLVCAAAYFVLRRFVRFPFLPQKKEPTA